MGQPSLIDYGILNEKSDYRVHVCFGERALYLFKTRDGVNACQSGKYRKAKAKQPGITFHTAEGFIVPPSGIRGCVRVAIPIDLVGAVRCSAMESTSGKGQKAVRVVSEMLVLGMIPIELCPSEVSAKDLQISGTDIIVQCCAKLQVKCDYNGGLNGTGNLFLQIAEINPNRYY